MKIRHKQSGVELEGRFVVGGARAHDGFTREWFASVDGSMYDRREWEAVPEWVEVTGACEVLQGVRLWHGERAIADMSHGYRLRKVSAVTLYPEGKAFIVERKA